LVLARLLLLASLFVYQIDFHVAYLLLYIDVIVLIASSRSFLDHIISQLHTEFSMTNLGLLHHLWALLLRVTLVVSFYLNDNIYLDLLSRAAMIDCQPSRTPVDTSSILSSSGDFTSMKLLEHNFHGLFHLFLNFEIFWF
jgi:hypothetical protein